MRKTYRHPNHAIPPEETLRETLEAICMTETKLANLANCLGNTISEIVAGKAPITADIALRLERVLGDPRLILE